MRMCVCTYIKRESASVSHTHTHTHKHGLLLYNSLTVLLAMLSASVASQIVFISTLKQTAGG